MLLQILVQRERNCALLNVFLVIHNIFLMNKRSFFFGFLLGVLLWSALSFYLYYSLTNEPLKLSSLQKNIFNIDDSDEDISRQSNSIKAERLVDGKSSYFKKKEKEKRKISKKLVEELQPVPEKQFADYGLIKTVEDQLIREEGFKSHAFNVLVSNHLGIMRDIPDTRHKV